MVLVWYPWMICDMSGGGMAFRTRVLGVGCCCTYDWVALLLWFLRCVCQDLGLMRFLDRLDRFSGITAGAYHLSSVVIDPPWLSPNWALPWDFECRHSVARMHTIVCVGGNEVLHYIWIGITRVFWTGPSVWSEQESMLVPDTDCTISSRRLDLHVLVCHLSFVICHLSLKKFAWSSYA